MCGLGGRLRMVKVSLVGAEDGADEQAADVRDLMAPRCRL